MSEPKSRKTTKVVTTRWGRRSWREVDWPGPGRMGRPGRAWAAARDARAEVWCRCGELVVIDGWNEAAGCEKCGAWYKLACAVKIEVLNE